MTRVLLTRGQPTDVAERRREQGVLFGSGLVGGGGLTAVVLALWVVTRGGTTILGWPLDVPNVVLQGLSLATILLIVGLMALWAVRGGRVRAE